MRTKFISPNGKTIKLTTSDQTFGGDSTGEKSRQYRANRSLIEHYRFALNYLPNTSVSPELFANFFNRIGVRSKSPEACPYLICNSEFNWQEISEVMGALEPFRGLMTAIRYDGIWATGNGMGHTEFIRVPSGKNDIGEILRKVKSVVASEFQENVRAFKERLGHGENFDVGIMAMPLTAPPVKGTKYCSALHHIQARAEIIGGKIVYEFKTGYGIGGADHSLEAPFALEGRDKEINHPADNQNDYVYFNQNGKIERYSKFYDIPAIGKLFRGKILDFEQLQSLQTFQKMSAKTGKQYYFELSTEHQSERFNVLQIAEIHNAKPVKPEVRPENILFHAKNAEVYSEGTVEAQYVVHGRITDVAEINAKHPNFLLICDLTGGKVLHPVLFERFSKASAIFDKSSEHEASFMGHMYGALREAGIIVFHSEEKISKIFPVGTELKKNLIIYANKEDREVIIALKE